MASSKKATLLSTDSKIGDIVATIALYESLHLAVASLGDDSVPVGHSHFIEQLLSQAKTVFKKSANKTIIKDITTLISQKTGTNKASKASKASNASNTSIKASIIAEIRKLKTEFDALVKTRTQMCKVVSANIVTEIIKKASKQPTVAKARAHVKKEAKRLGLCESEEVRDYLD